MKILMVSTVEVDKNGIATCIINYSQQIAKENVEIHIAGPNAISQDIALQLKGAGIEYQRLTNRKEGTVKYLLELKRLVHRERYDVVHVHGNSCTMAIDLLGALLGGCKVRIAHSHNTTCQHMKAHKILRPLFEICCNRRFACGYDAGRWLFNKKKFVVIKNGVLLEQYLPNIEKRQFIRQKYGITDKQIMLGHIGIFNYQKNHDFLVGLMKRLSQMEPNKYKMIMLGHGEEFDRIKQLVHENGLGEDIIMAGKVSNINEYFQAMDLFVLPSRFEGLPYVLVEAQASGVKCVTSTNVSTEANICDGVDFIELENMEAWISRCNAVNAEDFFVRSSYIDTWHEKLKQKGYDIATNGEIVKELYSDKKKYNQKIANKK